MSNNIFKEHQMVSSNIYKMIGHNTLYKVNLLHSSIIILETCKLGKMMNLLNKVIEVGVSFGITQRTPSNITTIIPARD